jgi:iron complex transport system ATP-binding protein
METMLLLHRLAHEHNKAILLSSHDLSQAVMLADELWIVTHDRQVLSGNTEDLALTGAMDSIFASQNISFNLSQGDFCINIDCPHSVNLKSDDAVLTRWIANALARNGYRINSDSQCDITITATSPRNFSVEKANRLITATSINDLIAALATLS